MKKFLPVLFILLTGILACEPEEEKITTSLDVKLAFSTDTVLFDTLLTERLSVTKRLRIYNPNDKAVKIHDIRLGKGRASDYSMIVNGQSGTTIKDQVLFGGDSLLILVSVEIDQQNKDLPYLVKDSITVSWGKYLANVKLVAYGQDANFVNSRLICDEVWTADRPYVIYNFALLDSLCTLTVQPGTKIYLDNGASFFVQGSLKILGDSGRHVTIRNTRFDPDYLEAPGQWGGIYFLEGSKDNEIRYADIENGEIGLRVGTPDDDEKYDLEISHTTIRHMSVAGILAFSSDVYAYNTLIHNAGGFLVGNLAGGNYKYEHCTFTNVPSFFISDDPMIQFSDNVILADDDVLVGDLSVEITNSILWGEGVNQLFVGDGGGATVVTKIQSNIIKSKEEWPDNYVSQERNYPGFKDPFTFNYQLDSLAFARDKGVNISISDDITGHLRDSKPDIGAFERIDPK